jgi:hypothetical protein
MRIGVTGHQNVEPGVWPWVIETIDALFARLPTPLVGVSSLAIGADQVFAERVLAHGGALEVVLPFADYENELEESDEVRERFRHLVASARRVQVLDPLESKGASYFEAGKVVVRECELLVAVWDGRPARNPGGTGDAVRFARELGREILHLHALTRTVATLSGK